MIGAFVCVCEEDKGWIPQFLENHALEGIPVVVVADHLEKDTVDTLGSVTVIRSNEQFSERTKSKGLEELKRQGFKWGIQMDIDETWQKGAGDTLRKTLENEKGHIGKCEMVQVYDGMRRIDGTFAPNAREGSRERIYNLEYDWKYLDPFTNGAHLMDGSKQSDSWVSFDVPAKTFHWGYSTKKLRLAHKEKWHRIYDGWGRNPYQTYNWMTDETVVPILVPLDE